MGERRPYPNKIVSVDRRNELLNRARHSGGSKKIEIPLAIGNGLCYLSARNFPVPMARDLIISLYRPDTEQPMEVPCSDMGVSAGFPSPADDFMPRSLDLNRELVRHPASTFYARVNGDSMTGDGIDDGDLLVIDKAVEPYDGCIAVCFLDGEFTLKRVRIDAHGVTLVPANPKYRPIPVAPDNRFIVWGVVRYVIKKV